MSPFPTLSLSLYSTNLSALVVGSSSQQIRMIDRVSRLVDCERRNGGNGFGKRIANVVVGMSGELRTGEKGDGEKSEGRRAGSPRVSWRGITRDATREEEHEDEFGFSHADVERVHTLKTLVRNLECTRALAACTRNPHQSRDQAEGK